MASMRPKNARWISFLTVTAALAVVATRAPTAARRAREGVAGPVAERRGETPAHVIHDSEAEASPAGGSGLRDLRLPLEPPMAEHALIDRLTVLGADEAAAAAVAAELEGFWLAAAEPDQAAMTALTGSLGLEGEEWDKAELLAWAFLAAEPMSLVGIELEVEDRLFLDELVSQGVAPEAAAWLLLSAREVGWPADASQRESLRPLAELVTADTELQERILDAAVLRPQALDLVGGAGIRELPDRRIEDSLPSPDPVPVRPVPRLPVVRPRHVHPEHHVAHEDRDARRQRVQDDPVHRPGGPPVPVLAVRGRRVGDLRQRHGGLRHGVRLAGLQRRQLRNAVAVGHRHAGHRLHLHPRQRQGGRRRHLHARLARHHRQRPDGAFVQDVPGLRLQPRHADGDVAVARLEHRPRRLQDLPGSRPPEPHLPVLVLPGRRRGQLRHAPRDQDELTGLLPGPDQ